MQTVFSMMKINKSSLTKVLKTVIAAAPAIPYLYPRRRSNLGAYILGGVGFALAGGLAALMFFSPRTRTRALGVAKDTYGKVNGKITDLVESDIKPMANGIVNHAKSEIGTTTGL
jgi:hypothetical protein